MANSLKDLLSIGLEDDALVPKDVKNGIELTTKTIGITQTNSIDL